MPDPRPTPDPDDLVRRLLAQARHEEPLPVDVGIRLDRVLAGLRTEVLDQASQAALLNPVSRVNPGSPGSPVSLDVRRHRRRAVARLLLAAAAVVIVGVGVAGLLGQRNQDDSAGSSATSASTSRDGASPETAPGGSSASSAAGVAGGSNLGYRAIARDLPARLRSGSFDRDVRAASRLAARLADPLQTDAPLAAALAEPLPGWSCGTGTSTASYGAGVLLPATYDGTPVVLALRPAAGAGVPAQVLACGTAQVLRRTVIPAS